MSAETATGLVLRCRPLTETSLIVHWLTREQGRLATVARGARRPKSPFRGKLDVAYRARFAFVRSRRSELHTLVEAVLEETHPSLRTDLDRLRMAAYAIRLLEQTTETDTPVPELFDLLDALLHLLDTRGAGPVLSAAFELHFLAAMGLRPDPARTPLPAAARATLVALLDRPLNTAAAMTVVPPTLRSLERFLGAFLREHLGRTPPGRETAWESKGPAPRPAPQSAS